MLTLILGGQYHWVSEFAPARYQKVLSYFAGWQATMSWQAGNASGPFVMGTLIQSLIAMNFPDYDSPRWQGTLMVIANIALVYAANAYGTEYIPVVQNTLMVLHVFLFFAVVVPLWVLAPHASAGQVFTDFYNGGGWSSMFLAVMVLYPSPVFPKILLNLSLGWTDKQYLGWPWHRCCCAYGRRSPRLVLLLFGSNHRGH